MAMQWIFSHLLLRFSLLDTSFISFLYIIFLLVAFMKFGWGSSWQKGFALFIFAGARLEMTYFILCCTCTKVFSLGFLDNLTTTLLQWFPLGLFYEHCDNFPVRIVNCNLCTTIFTGQKMIFGICKLILNQMTENDSFYPDNTPVNISTESIVLCILQTLRSVTSSGLSHHVGGRFFAGRKFDDIWRDLIIFGS
jgi:hypothetical protein